ncbi:MAG: AAA family ATPase [Caldilinea sp. CFX5]|nr:AAA family ATPase [Caldilinea sp. CFX5]
MEGYATSLQHLLAELERIDLLLQLQVGRARQLHATDEAFQGLYIPEEEVDHLLVAPAGLPRWATDPLPLAQAEVQNALDQLALQVAWHKTVSKQRGIPLRLDQLAQLFQLDALDLDILLICLAPEIDLRYERLFGYLQDDITKKRPTVDLVLNLLSPSLDFKLTARARFAPNAPLVKHHLLHLFEDPAQVAPPLLNKCLKVEERVVSYLLDSDRLDQRLALFVEHRHPQLQIEEVLLPAEVKRRLVHVVRTARLHNTPLVFYFQGPADIGQARTAEALCREVGKTLLVVDGARWVNANGRQPNQEADLSTIVALLRREALFQNAVLYWSAFDRVQAEQMGIGDQALLHELAADQGLTILAGDALWEPTAARQELAFVRVEFPGPSYVERIQWWQRALQPVGHQVGHAALAGTTGEAVNLDELASKFRLSGGQIQAAANTARNLARWRDPEQENITIADLHTACRLHSNRKLATLARQITPHYRWTDIILPVDRLQQLREICNQVKHRALVHDEWGFDRKLSLGKGLNVLFAGPSGTGKTMAAEVVANELLLDLYQIDLSQVVSKYIGETEKNLDRIFREAQTSNAILFFDEADALFGKRSEVKDAHDRYANIEIGYLLQKMEEYEGMAILATNLRANLDEAFARRMHFIIEFPFPDEEQRYRIWCGVFPAEAPLAADVDFAALAQAYKLSGGNIRNIALAAAFLAAEEQSVIGMNHLQRAAKREFQKVGRTWDDANRR